MYIHHLADYPALEAQFNAAGYTLEVDLSNSLIIEKEGIWIEYDNLPKDLRTAIDEFSENNDLN